MSKRKQLGVSRTAWDELDRVPPLTPRGELDMRAFLGDDADDIMAAWRVWENTMFLSGGDRAQADRAFDDARKLKKGKP